MQEETNTNQYAFGALINSNDNRDIHYSAVAGTAPAQFPESVITDVSVLPVENQLQLGTCVGQAEGKGEEYREYKETGHIVPVSKRFIYLSSKKKDGDPNQGTYPRIAAGVLRNEGAPKTELVPDDNGLSYTDYMAYNIDTDEIKTDASGRRVLGYAFCYTLNDVKQAIVNRGVVNASLQVGDWSRFPIKPIPAAGLHRVMLFGYTDGINNGTPDTKIYFRNSWGTNWGQSTDGNGWFWWSEYEKYVYDMMVYTDMPDTVINYAKQQQYIFTRILHIGMSGTDVTELQKRLNKEIALDGFPCFRYPTADNPTFTTFFGSNTQDAVQRYQAKNGLVSSGTYNTTGYGQVGPKTMQKLNTGATTASKMDAWADAIQQHEGWYVGSRSYRNNNPGNIKYVGQSLAVGQDTGGFCIFKTYADGRKCLTDMLTRAATPPVEGKYSPDMTLAQFFAVYAPSSDNNNPDAYATFVAAKIGVTVDTPIKNLLS